MSPHPESTYLERNGLMLPERRKRLENLIHFVRQMGLLDDISQVVRRQLAEDATMLAIGMELSDLLSTRSRRKYVASACVAFRPIADVVSTTIGPQRMGKGYPRGSSQTGNHRDAEVAWYRFWSRLYQPPCSKPRGNCQTCDRRIV